MIRGSEKGFTLLELIAGMAIVALIALAASMSLFQVVKGDELGNNRTIAIRQVQNAGYWISRDTQMAASVVTDNLTPPDLLILNWAEPDYSGGDSIYHSVIYFLEDLSDGIGKLKRTHWSSAGANEQTLVASYIYYNPDDPDNTSKASYQSPVLTLQLAAHFGDVTETREYRVGHRISLCQ